MKVLFISPIDPDKPGKLKLLVGGENTFTRSLLSQPPKGVEYTHHLKALKDDDIVSSSWQKPLSYLTKARILPPDAGIQCLEIKDKFDLIHCHGYSLKLKGYSGPVILSDSSSNCLFLKDYLGWSQARIDFCYKLRGLLAKKLNIYDPNLNLYKAHRLICWSGFAKKIHTKLGGDPKKIVVIPPGIPKLKVKKIRHQGFNILFIGIWFRRKGGDLLLKAYRILKEKYPQIKLTLIGQLPQGTKLPEHVWHRQYLSREKLIRDIFPQADVLVLVPPVAEGYGLVVLEAACLAIPSIVSPVYALTELVEDGKTGFIIPPSDLAALISRLERLIKNKTLMEEMGQAAQKKFFRKFWIKRTNRKLLKAYQEAIG